MRYTICGIPERLDTILRERARAENKSLSAVALEAALASHDRIDARLWK